MASEVPDLVAPAAPEPGAGSGAVGAQLAGLATILVVALPVVMRAGLDLDRWLTATTALSLGLLTAFAGLFWWNSCDGGRAHSHAVRRVSIALMSVIAVAYSAGEHHDLGGILLVLVATVLIDAVPIRAAIVWTAAQTAAFGWLGSSAGWSEMLISLAAFSGFQVFALYTSWVAHLERTGRQLLAQAHAELAATQHLLAASSRSSERLRIAQELHDVLGHHLTALSLRLEATRHTKGEAREDHLQEAREIISALLGEVRSVVSEWRHEPSSDLIPALHELARGYRPAAGLGGPVLSLEVPATLALDDPRQAHILLRAAQELLTNTVRHARATATWLTLEEEAAKITLRVTDDGCGSDQLVPGNGLCGLRERVEDAGGSLTLLSRQPRGLEALVELPRHLAVPGRAEGAG